MTLTYSDMHPRRFSFFQALLNLLGATWFVPESRVTAGLNHGAAHTAGTATFACPDTASLTAALEGIGARIVFLIDWNRAEAPAAFRGQGGSRCGVKRSGAARSRPYGLA